MYSDRQHPRTLPRIWEAPKLNLSLLKAHKLLSCFSVEEPALSVGELARRTGLTKSTASRLLASLAALGILQLDQASGKYRLGLRLVELAGQVLVNLDFRAAVKPVMLEVSRVTRETVNVGVRDGDSVVIVEEISSPEPLRVIGWVGHRVPLHCTSPGKVMLAFDEQLAGRVLSRPLRRYTHRTKVNRESLEAELKEIRRRGYAINLEEWYPRTAGVAVPFRDHTGRIAGVLNVAGPLDRMDERRCHEFGRLLASSAVRLSRQLGYRCQAAGREVTLATRREGMYAG